MTLKAGEISNYPFTTKSPDTGIAQAVTLCVHKEFNLQDNPKNSKCEEGWRFIPIEVTDLPGLIKGAWMGKGLGNQFLSVAAQSDALLHVVDASGSVDKDGRISDPGSGLADAVSEVLHGIGVKKNHVTFALKEALLEDRPVEAWNEKEIQNFC